MAKIDALQFFYPSKYLSADGDAITEQTADAGGSTTTIVDSALTQADDYWNGAVCIFEPDTTTVALRGAVAHVMDFDAASDTLTLARTLPAAPAAGDTYRLILGGYWRSGTEIPGLTATGLSAVTGVVINYASYYNGEGNGTLAYDQAADTLTWTAPGGSAGSPVDVSGGGAVVLYSNDESKFIRVTVTHGSLPGSNQSDTIALDRPIGVLIPWQESEETLAGKTRYYAVCFKNTDGADSIYEMKLYLAKEIASAAATTLTAGLIDGGSGTDVLEAADLTNWPTSGWVYNSDKDDVRYFYNRSGNSATVADPGAGKRGYTSAAWDSADNIELLSDVDIGLGVVDGSLNFENPANETTAPSGVTFSAPMAAVDGLAIAELAAGDFGVVWFREVIDANARAKSSVLSKLLIACEVTG